MGYIHFAFTDRVLDFNMLSFGQDLDPETSTIEYCCTTAGICQSSSSPL